VASAAADGDDECGDGDGRRRHRRERSARPVDRKRLLVSLAHPRTILSSVP